MELTADLIKSAEFMMMDGQLITAVTLNLAMDSTQLAEFMKIASNGNGRMKLVLQ